MASFGASKLKKHTKLRHQYLLLLPTGTINAVRHNFACRDPAAFATSVVGLPATPRASQVARAKNVIAAARPSTATQRVPLSKGW